MKETPGAARRSLMPDTHWSSPNTARCRIIETLVAQKALKLTLAGAYARLRVTN